MDVSWRMDGCRNLVIATEAKKTHCLSVNADLRSSITTSSGADLEMTRICWIKYNDEHTYTHAFAIVFE